MNWLDGLPTWGLAALIFSLRVVDVSMGTLRTLAVVQGRLQLSVVLGFFEVLVWVTAIAQVIPRLQTDPLVGLAYAAGFATGNAVGILLERRLAFGEVSVNIISPRAGEAVAQHLRRSGQRLTTFEGGGIEGPVTMIYTTTSRRGLRWLLDQARTIDPHIFYTVEPLREGGSSTARQPLPRATGWRGLQDEVSPGGRAFLKSRSGCSGPWGILRLAPATHPDRPPAPGPGRTGE